jgi:NAD(P)-dependent dehydrogenase (short-subunit alcohol dehydrogenase family)
MQINGKRAMVVGGASGMARATAEMLRKAGAEVSILDLPTSNGAEVADGMGASFHPCNVLDEASVSEAFGAAMEALGSLHIAVNTAGGGVAQRTLTREGPHSLEDFRFTVEISLISTFNLNRLQAWEMKQNEPEEEERGVIIDTSSVAAFEGQIGQVAYAAAKAGLAGMMLPMARDLGSFGIRAVAIAPSLFDTGITAGAQPEWKAERTKDNAFPRRMGQPEEYAKLALAIIENPMLNGTTIRLDAGVRFAPK